MSVMQLSAAELATLWCPPTQEMGDRIDRVAARWLPAPAKAFIGPNDPAAIPLGLGRRSDGSWAPIGLSYPDLRYICHITAPMGRGKSKWLENLALGLLQAGAGFFMLDCKAKDLVNNTLPLIPMSREGDVTILDLGGTTASGEDLRVSMNLLSRQLGASLGMKPSVMASTVLNVFAVLDPRFNEAVGIKQFANMGILALMGGEPNATLMHLIRFFGDEEYRAGVCSRLPGSLLTVKDFWERRFAEMPDSQKASLASFERRLDQMLSFPELQAMLVAPGCSINMRELMDNRGILLAGVSASEGQITNIAVTLLLTQMLLAALSRTNVPEEQRQDWPMIIDEVQIIANSNAELFKVMLSQLRAMRVGQVHVHQNLGQIAGEIMEALQGNAQNRVILGSENVDAGQYATQYGALGLTREDFTQMEVFMHQYVKFYGAGNLFSARPLPVARPLNEGLPPDVYVDWRAVRAEAKNDQEQTIDEYVARFKRLAALRWDEAVQRLGLLAQHKPAAFDAYCARTRAHREAQRRFILDNPGCIPYDKKLPPEQAALQQKDRRVRILSALKSGLPKLETEALAYSLLMASREAAAAAKERAEEEAAAKKAAKKGGSGGGGGRAKAGGEHAQTPHPDAAPQVPRPMRATAGDDVSAHAQIAHSNAISARTVEEVVSLPVKALPKLNDLLSERGSARGKDDVLEGIEL